VARDIGVDRAGLVIPHPVDEPVDVLFDGRRVWSFNPARDAKSVGASRVVHWPTALRPYLHGVAHVTLVRHGDAEHLFAGDVAFGKSPDRIRLVDDANNPLSVDKSGRIQREFTFVKAEMRAEIVDAVEKVLHDLREECGLDAFLSYGCLLGAVRDGHMIGHDSDADVSYLSKYTHPFDIVRESRTIGRAMRRLGWQVVRMSGANFKVWLPLEDGRRVGIDVFGAFHIDGYFHMMGSLRGKLDRSVVLPLGTVTLEGRALPAPGRPEEFLEFTYGPSWRIPDPAFKFGHDPADVHRMDAWFRATRRRVRFWHDFYRSPRANRVPKKHSLFAAWVDERIEPKGRVIDVGSGTGRDSVWFAQSGHPVLALDFAGSAAPMVRKMARQQDVSLRVDTLNLENLRNVLVTGARLAHQPDNPIVYARGLLDTLGPIGRANFWRFASMLQRGDGQTFVEFRTETSRHEPKHFGEHLRTYLDPDAVVREIEQYGGTVVEQVVGRGLAPLGREDPEICRLVVRWKR
jgi:SAM-dependent methyltransferase